MMAASACSIGTTETTDGSANDPAATTSLGTIRIDESLPAIDRANPTPKCAALESFLINDLPKLDTMLSHDDQLPIIAAPVLDVAPTTAQAWEQLSQLQSDRPVTYDLDVIERHETLSAPHIAIIQNATMAACGIPYFSAGVLTMLPTFGYCWTITHDGIHEPYPGDCPTPQQPATLPCFSTSTHVPVDCDTGERLALTMEGTWQPIAAAAPGDQTTTTTP